MYFLAFKTLKYQDALTEFFKSDLKAYDILLDLKDHQRSKFNAIGLKMIKMLRNRLQNVISLELQVNHTNTAD